MKTALLVLMFAAAGWTQNADDQCCKCDQSFRSGRGAEVVCLTPKEMHSRVEHLEPLRPSGLGKGVNLTGRIVLQVRFGADGKVECARAKSGHPIAISAAMEAIKKWIFRPPTPGGEPKAGCGSVTIKYRLRDRGSTTELGAVQGRIPQFATFAGTSQGGYGYDGSTGLRI